MQETSLEQYIGIRLKQRRVKLGITQAVLASTLQCSYQLIQKYESGETRIHASTLMHVAKVLGVDLQYFLDGYVSSERDMQRIPAKGDTLSDQSKKEWNLLLIEDNPEDAYLFINSIQQLDIKKSFLVHTCYDGQDAYGYLKKNYSSNPDNTTPDIIFLDINIPKLSGFELLSVIKKDRNLDYIPVVILTNSINADEMLACYKQQAMGYLRKAYDIKRFRNNIESVLRYWTEAVVTPRNF
jgi:CheY-like chemotaxis protein/DNA-binding XRE family transcriptional regulator